MSIDLDAYGAEELDAPTTMPPVTLADARGRNEMPRAGAAAPE